MAKTNKNWEDVNKITERLISELEEISNGLESYEPIEVSMKQIYDAYEESIEQ